LLEGLYEWYIYALSDDVDGEAAQGGRRSLTSILETVASSRATGNSSSAPIGHSWLVTPMIRPDGTPLLRWSGGSGSKWDNVGKPGLIFGLRAWQVVNFWNPTGKMAGGAAMAIEEGLIDEEGRALSDWTTR